MTITDTSRADYDAIEAVNYSTAKHALRSMLHYRQAVKEGFGDKPEYAFGRAGHIGVFEPARFATDVAVWDGPGDRRTNAYKAWAVENAGRELLKRDEYLDVLGVVNEVRANNDAAKYLASGQSEVTVVWTDPGTGLKCKGRIDFICDVPGLECILDLKSTTDASPDAFGRQAFRLHYPFQAAFYRDAVFALTGKRLPFLWIAAEKTAPYAVQVYRAGEDSLDIGRADYQDALAKIAAARKADAYPAYANGEMDLLLPRWAYPGESDGEDWLTQAIAQ